MTNFDVRTIAFTQPEVDLLRLLLQNDLPSHVHAAVTAFIAPALKTAVIMKAFNEHSTMMRLLQWSEDDKVRAYRQINTEALLYLHQLVMGANPSTMGSDLAMGFKTYAPSILQGLQRAMDTGLDKPIIPINLAKAPAKA